jgi:hypothetical protein
MAITATRVKQGHGKNLPWITDGHMTRTVTDVAFTTAYTDLGEPLTATDLGLRRVSHASAEPTYNVTNAVPASFAGYDPATSLLHVYDHTPAELATATGDATGLTIRVVAWGTPYTP